MHVRLVLHPGLDRRPAVGPADPRRRRRSPERAGAVRDGLRHRFPLDDLDRLLLATDAGDAPLAARHGAPVRLVAPGRRGFWWVKWVTSVELSDRPPWWQSPFPLS
ncbi:molybdopterin-dependent oxidoreductase [Goekera deserti]|uniref:molybdopterin-dependent oxidoreductase n=1 Tax=Goekera deserti TaxID=2497753 RepID=UPI0039A43F1B